MVFNFGEICGAVPEDDYGLPEELKPDGEKTPDLKPEFCQYVDDGCEFARSCLECPYSVCVYDQPVSRRRKFRTIRDKQICRLFKSGRDVNELADIFNLSGRTVQRIVKGKIINRQVFKRRSGEK